MCRKVFIFVTEDTCLIKVFVERRHQLEPGLTICRVQIEKLKAVLAICTVQSDSDQLCWSDNSSGAKSSRGGNLPRSIVATESISIVGHLP